MLLNRASFRLRRTHSAARSTASSAFGLRCTRVSFCAPLTSLSLKRSNHWGGGALPVEQLWAVCSLLVRRSQPASRTPHSLSPGCLPLHHFPTTHREATGVPGLSSSGRHTTTGWAFRHNASGEATETCPHQVHPHMAVERSDEGQDAAFLAVSPAHSRR